MNNNMATLPKIGTKIEAKEHPLWKIFGLDFVYSIPPYQRPYSWTKENAGILFDDLYDSYRDNREEDYFLGSIVLIKEDSEFKVIDGQQRLTTLTILLAILEDEKPEGSEISFRKYLEQGEEIAEGKKARPRLSLRDKDQSFFKKHILRCSFDGLGSFAKTEPQKHMAENSEVLKEKVRKVLGSDEEITRFGQFLMQRCYLVAISTSNEESAVRIFSVMNSRGLNLQNTDILKANIIREISTEKQESYTRKWEELEDNLGREKFEELFRYIYIIYMKRRPKKSLLEEFTKDLLESSRIKDRGDFIDEILTPYAEICLSLLEENYENDRNVKGAEEVNELLGWLNKIDKGEWLPPAIKFLTEADKCSDTSIDDVLWFFQKLERLSVYFYLASASRDTKINRYAKVVSELEKSSGSSSFSTGAVSSIELSSEEMIEFMIMLDGDVYKEGAAQKRCKYLLLRLDSFLSDRAAVYKSAPFSVEHVLPQNPAKEWEEWWPDKDQHKNWVHKLANLVPLKRSKNSQVKNYSYELKKIEYFEKGRANSYRLTDQLKDEPEWTPEVLARRQKELLEILEKNWELS